MSARVLVVEDDERIRSSLRLCLEDEGFVVDEAGSAEEAIADTRGRMPDAVLIDLMLPGMDGFELCRRVRTTSSVPIIIVTARGDSHDVVAGLEAGADDYVTKPFVPKELTARIRALLRRVSGMDVHPLPFAFGEVELRPDEGVVTKGGQEIHLTKTEFRLLSELAGSAGRVLSRERLLERVWEYDYFGDARLVDVHIRRLRGKIEDDASNPRHIVTVRGLGYKLQS